MALWAAEAVETLDAELQRAEGGTQGKVLIDCLRDDGPLARAQRELYARANSTGATAFPLMALCRHFELDDSVDEVVANCTSFCSSLVA